tara:strand:+ start:247 stop:939 length:693 start_codon:yes stop_codon:yes gene_type:complete
MKILVIEDEVQAKNALINLIKLVYKHPIEIKDASTVETALSILESFQPNLIFLDIELGDESGFDIIDQHSDADFGLIVTTGKEEHALKAIKHKALDYLLKPVDPEELEIALNKFSKRTESSFLAPDGFIKLNTANSIHKINISDIVYCESDNNYTTVVTTDAKKIVTSKTLKHIEDTLPKNGFLRIHRSFLVNKSHIDSFNKVSSEIELKNGNALPVSRANKASLLALFE